MSKTEVYLLGIFFFSSCVQLEEIRQLRTYTDLQVISKKIEQLRTVERIPSRAEIGVIVKEVESGLDAWGTPIRWYVRESENGWSHVVISSGGDGKPDFVEEDYYFEMQEQDIRGEVWRDIVFRDGLAVTLAGK